MSSKNTFVELEKKQKKNNPDLYEYLTGTFLEPKYLCQDLKERISVSPVEVC